METPRSASLETRGAGWHRETAEHGALIHVIEPVAGRAVANELQVVVVVRVGPLRGVHPDVDGRDDQVPDAVLVRAALAHVERLGAVQAQPDASVPPE